jgi:hypothetical protein
LSGDALQDADPSSSPLSVSPTAIPPPPSPRRHKSIVQRSRAVSSESSAAAGPSGSSAFPSSKSSVELRALGLAMTSSSLPVAPTDRRGSLDTASRYAFGDSRIADEPLEWEGDASALDNR